MALEDSLKNRRGTGFAGVSRNIAAGGGRRLGSFIGQQVAGEGERAKEEFQQAQSQFDVGAQKGALDTEQNKAIREQVLSKYATPTGTEAPTEQELSKFQQFRSGQYVGPTQLKDQTALVGRAQEAESLGRLGQTGAGRQQLLQRFVGDQGYSRGEQKLDTALLGGEGSALARGRRATAGLESQVQQAGQLAGEQAKEYAGRARGFADETLGKIQETRQPTSTQIDTRLASLTGEEQAKLQAYNKLKDQLYGRGEFEGKRDPIEALSKLQEGQYISPEDVKALVGDVKGLRQLQEFGRAGTLQDELNKVYGGTSTSFDPESQAQLKKLLTGQQSRSIETDALALGDVFSDGSMVNRDLTKQAGYLSDQELAQLRRQGFNVKEAGIGKGIMNDEAMFKNMFTSSATPEGYKQYLLEGATRGSYGANRPGTYRRTETTDIMKELSPELINQLTGSLSKSSLSQAAAAGGLDFGKELEARLGYKQAAGLTRGGVATEQEKAALTALDRLAGRTGTDVEDLTGGIEGLYTKGQGTFARGSLEQEVNRALAEKANRMPNMQMPGESVPDMARAIGDIGGDVTTAGGNMLARFIENPNDWGNVINPYLTVGKGFLSAPGDTLKSIPKGLLYTAANPIKNVSRALKKLCFDLDTPIELTNGDIVQIQNLKQGMEVRLGGKVISNNIVMSDEMVKYNNTFVSPSHAIYENNTWIRVGDSEKVFSRYFNTTFPVCQVITENNLLFIDNMIWSDYEEIPGSTEIGLSDEVNLYLMNANKKRNEELSSYLDKMER